MGVVISQLCIDSVDPASLAAWWADVLGWQVEADDPDEIWVSETPESAQGLLFLRVPEDKVIKNRLHLDIRPADGSNQDAELERLLAMGATPVDVGQGDASWHVLADPQGNEFCLLHSTPAELAAQAAAEG